jgi:hypothetical protein
METNEKKNIQVISKRVYSGKPAEPEETAANVQYLAQGGLRHEDLVDRDIEHTSLREGLPIDEGNISITVLPGERIGELSANIQFEGKSGEREICLKEQDELLQYATEWLSDILSGFGMEFHAEIEASPCPHAAARIRVDLAARRLEGAKIQHEPIVHEVPRRVGGKHVVGKKRSR